ncbi:MAG: hypothetical protein KTR33_07245 [Gammaproteobacteria bacterium]|nr:hypothetical protein [Gammaproteobacteria bacterium]
MLDSAKRRTLKILTATGLGGVAAGLAGKVSALVPGSEIAASVGDKPLAMVTVGTRVSAMTNDIEVVLRNVGVEDTLITQLTPNRVTVGRGVFDFSGLLAAGPLPLKAGEAVVVPLQTHAPAQNSSVAGYTSGSLLETLRQSVSVVTDGNAFASVSIAPAIALA